MDRTSLTAALKPLERRGLVRVAADRSDRRSRLIAITADGVALLEAALPTWRETHAQLDAAMSAGVPDRLRADLRQVPPVAATLSAAGDGQDGPSSTGQAT